MRTVYQRPSMSGFGMLPPTPRSLKKLLWINAIAWFAFALGFGFRSGPVMWLFTWLSLTPSQFLSGAIWQPLTYMFLHDPGGLWHVGLNLFALWMFGGTLARDWGSQRFLHFYLICGAGAGLVDVVVRVLGDTAGVPTVGASGAVLAVVTAFAVTYPNTPILISFILPVPAWVVAVAYAAINLLGAIQDFSHGGNPSGTAFTVHLAGMALGLYFVRRKAGLPTLPSIDFEARRRERELRRARKKFQVYMRNREKDDGGPWVN